MVEDTIVNKKLELKNNILTLIIVMVTLVLIMAIIGFSWGKLGIKTFVGLCVAVFVIYGFNSIQQG